jgi:hypothetical protein
MNMTDSGSTRQSGAKATAVQTLRDGRTSSKCAKRLDCGAFTAAFGFAGDLSHETFLNLKP